MNTVQLSAEKREDRAKSKTKALRKEGKIPAVVYGNKVEPFSVTVAERDFRKVYYQGKRNTLINLEIDGTSTTVIVFDVQRDTFNQSVSHIDFKVVTGNEPIKVQVALKLDGVPYGVKTEGGKMFQPTKVATIACDPNSELPESITLDVSQFKSGHTFYVRDLDFGAAKLSSSDKAVLFSITKKGGRKEKTEEEGK